MAEDKAWLDDCDPKMAQAWRRDAAEKPSTKFDTSLTPERTGMFNQVAAGSPTANRSAPSSGDLLSNELTRAKGKGGGDAPGKLLGNALTRARGRKK